MNDQLHINEIFSSIQGEGMLAGYRQIFIRFTDCNLDCDYCDTDFTRSGTCRIESAPGSSELLDMPQPQQLQQVTSRVADWVQLLPGAHHSVSLTGGEPLLHADQLQTWLPQLRKLLPVHLETNGTMHLALEKVLDQLDFISMDMKLPSTSGCTEDLWDLHRLFLARACTSRVSVKIVVGDQTDVDEVVRVCQTMRDIAATTPLFLQPLSCSDGTIGIATGHLLQLQAAAASRLPDVRVIPQMHKLMGVL